MKYRTINLPVELHEKLKAMAGSHQALSGVIEDLLKSHAKLKEMTDSYTDDTPQMGGG